MGTSSHLKAGSPHDFYGCFVGAGLLTLGLRIPKAHEAKAKERAKLKATALSNSASAPRHLLIP